MIRSGSRTDALQFYTNKGTKSPYFGGKGGKERFVTIPKDYKIIGIIGRSGSEVDRFGVHIAKVTFT